MSHAVEPALLGESSNTGRLRSANTAEFNKEKIRF